MAASLAFDSKRQTPAGYNIAEVSIAIKIERDIRMRSSIWLTSIQCCNARIKSNPLRRRNGQITANNGSAGLGIVRPESVDRREDSIETHLILVRDWLAREFERR